MKQTYIEKELSLYIHTSREYSNDYPNSRAFDWLEMLNESGLVGTQVAQERIIIAQWASGMPDHTHKLDPCHRLCELPLGWIIDEKNPPDLPGPNPATFSDRTNKLQIFP